MVNTLKSGSCLLTVTNGECKLKELSLKEELVRKLKLEPYSHNCVRPLETDQFTLKPADTKRGKVVFVNLLTIVRKV